MKKSLILILGIILVFSNSANAAEIHYLLNFTIEPEQAIKVPVGDLVSFNILDKRYFVKIEKILDESNFNVGIFPRDQNKTPTFFTLRPEITLNLDANDDNKNDLKMFFLATNIKSDYVVIGFKVLEEPTNLEKITNETINEENNTSEVINNNNEVTGQIIKETRSNNIIGLLILIFLVIIGIIIGVILKKR